LPLVPASLDEADQSRAKDRTLIRFWNWTVNDRKVEFTPWFAPIRDHCQPLPQSGGDIALELLQAVWMMFRADDDPIFRSIGQQQIGDGAYARAELYDGARLVPTEQGGKIGQRKNRGDVLRARPRRKPLVDMFRDTPILRTYEVKHGSP
jgi:hypothetical protein